MANNILIIEDEKTLADLVAKILKASGFNVQTAHTVPQAHQVLSEFTPDLVLLDVKLPNHNEGIVFLREFRAIPEHVETPVIILSAKVQLHEVSEGMAAGASQYLCKPILIEDVIKQIRVYLTK